MPDRFKIKDGIVYCYSESGKEYHLTETSCDCKGFGFRRTCRHIEQAEEKGLFEKIKKAIKLHPKEITLPISRVIRKMRLQALIIFLRNCKIQPTREMLKDIEPQIEKDTKPEEVVEWAEKFKKGEKE